MILKRVISFGLSFVMMLSCLNLTFAGETSINTEVSVINDEVVSGEAVENSVIVSDATNDDMSIEGNVAVLSSKSDTGVAYSDTNEVTAMSDAKVYRIPSVNTGDAIKVYDKFNSLRITPKLEITADSYIYIKINNGSFDESMLSECEFKTEFRGATYDEIYSSIEIGMGINDALNYYICYENSRALPYKLEYIDSSTLKATLFPIGSDKVNQDNDDVTMGIPMYDIKLPAIAGSEEGKVTLSVDGTDTTIESCNDIVYAYNNGYTLSTSDYLPVDSQRAEREINAEQGLPILYNDLPNAIIVKPECEVLDGDTITLKISNGSFDESMLSKCEFKTEYTGSTWDTIYGEYEAAHYDFYEIFSEYLLSQRSRQLPYKLEYIDSSTLKVYLFPISDNYVNLNDTGIGVPIYRIALPAVAGNENGYTKVAVDCTASSIESGGWYTIARINSEPEYKEDKNNFINGEYSVSAGSQIMNNNIPTSLVIKPMLGVSKDESIIISIKNGSFDKSMLDECVFKTKYTVNTYDTIYSYMEAAGVYNALGYYIGNENSRKLPYKLEYIDSSTLKIYLFPIGDTYVNQNNDDVTQGIPIYDILLPIVAGEYNGNVEIAVDGNDSTIQTSGWYKVGTVEDGLDIVKIPYEATGGNIYFNKSTGAIVGADSGITSAVIPESIDGVSVTSIESNVFSKCTALESITIPDSITVIGENAIADTVTIYCSRGSYAETYAKENNIAYKNTDVTVLKGDITGDGVINRSDLLRLNKYFAGQDIDINTEAADVTGDGNINRSDLLRLNKYFAGLDVELK